MTFDLEKLYNFCAKEIDRFAQIHRDETFYAFAIDAGLLCLNSEEQFQKTVMQYQQNWDRKTRHFERWEDLTERDLAETRWLLEMSERLDGLDRTNMQACLAVINQDRAAQRKEGDRYRTEEGTQLLRKNTGDWAYQGFAEMTDGIGFDDRAYEEHYGMSDEAQKTSDYGTAMDKLVERLGHGTAFECLRKSPSFYVTRVEHNY